MSSDTLNLTPALYAYFQENTLREPAVLRKLRLETQKQKNAAMQISPEQGQFMALLIELLGAKKTLDIGTYTGYSALAVALALPGNGQVISCDVDTDTAQIATRFWQEAGVADKITLVLAPAKETLQKLIAQGEAGTFDLAFIDADKGNYPDYYELSLTLLRPGGLVAVDNVLWHGKVADQLENDPATKAIRSLNKKILEDARVSMSMIPIGDGLTLARKRC